MRRLIPSLCLVLLAPAASGHPIRAQLSRSGVDFLEAQLPTYVPTSLAPPPMTMTLFTCPGGREVTFTQQNTDVDLAVNAFDLSMPASGVLRVDMTVSVNANGEAYIRYPYACFGETTCNDSLWIDGARAVLDFTARVDENGQPRVELADVLLDLDPEEIDFSFSGCVIDDVVNFVVDMARKWAWDFLLAKVEDMAREQIGPRIEAILAGFASYEGIIGSVDFEARMTAIDITQLGLGVGADLDLTNAYPAAACVGEDPGEPASHPGPAPDLATGLQSHVAMAVNFGVLDDALYQLWHEGLLCITPEYLEAFGIELHLDHYKDLLPPLPEGTTLALEGRFVTPPRVEATETPGAATVTLVLRGMEADLVARIPGGEERRLRLSMDADVRASVRNDPGLGAMVMDMEDIAITRLDFDDELGLEEAGFDFAKISQLLQEGVLPGVLEKLSDVPVTGSFFGGLADYFVILRGVETTPSYLVAKADLFRKPAQDFGAPDTRIVSAPEGVASPKNAVITVDGSDAEIPAELLRFEVRVDGQVQEVTSIKKFTVGEEGRTDTYDVVVTALDLHDNRDPSPAHVEVTVDGIRPRLSLVDEPAGDLPPGPHRIAWEMSDDYTPVEQMRAVVEIREVPRQGGSTGELVEMRELELGATETDLDLPGGYYRVIVNVYDEAGNRGADSVTFSVQDTGGCGCSTTSRSSSSTLPLILLALVWGRSKLRQRSRNQPPEITRSQVGTE